MNQLKRRGFKPKLHILDNECSVDFKEKILENNMKYQLVPPHDPRRDVAEKAGQVSRILLFRYWLGQIPNSPQKVGAESCVRPSTSLTYYASQRWTPASQVLRSWMGSTITMLTDLPPYVVQWKCMLYQARERRGKPIQRQAIILEIHGNITGATKSGSQIHEVSEWDNQCSWSTNAWHSHLSHQSTRSFAPLTIYAKS